MDLDWLVERTEGRSPADLSAMVRMAAIGALRRGGQHITMPDMQLASLKCCS